MAIRNTLSVFVALALVATTSCSGGDPGRFAVTLSLTGLPDSTTRFDHYEVWAVVGGVARTAGKFRVVGTGATAEVLSFPRGERLGTVESAQFGPTSTRLGSSFPRVQDASHLFVTVEPEGDTDRSPSCQVLIAGAVVDDAAVLSAAGVLVAEGFPCSVPTGAGEARLGLADFSGAAGVFQLRSPTDDLTNPAANDAAGVWFVADGPGGLEPGLVLPTLPASMRYEGWAVVDGATRSLGTFRRADARDDDAFTAPQRGPDGPGFATPGQDFVVDLLPPFPFDPPVLLLADDQFDPAGDWIAYLTAEPEPDNAPGPFPLRLLEARIPPDAVDPDGRGAEAVDFVELGDALPTAQATLSAGALDLGALGLEGLGAATGRFGHYGLWVTIGGQPEPVTRFLIDGETVLRLDGGAVFGTRTASSVTAANSGQPAFPDLGLATEVFVTFEEEGAAGAEPGRRLVSGAVAAGVAQLDTAAAGLGAFALAEGALALRSPTNDAPGVPRDDGMGITFGFDGGFLSLQAPPQGWRYEAWVEDLGTGRRFSTGKILGVASVDENDQISQSRGFTRKPASPGEDFLFDVPAPSFLAAGPGSISEVFVTVETVPDGEIGPSSIRVLQAFGPFGATATDTPLAPGFDPDQLGGLMTVRVID